VRDVHRRGDVEVDPAADDPGRDAPQRDVADDVRVAADARHRRLVMMIAAAMPTRYARA
jgi:hypothetical protein